MVLQEIRIEGLRTLADVRLPLSGLTVVIGESGSGKSSLIEACRLLSMAASPDFFKEFRRTHWGFSGLLRQGATQLKLEVRFLAKDQVFRYELALTANAGGIVQERLLGTYSKPSFRSNKRIKPSVQVELWDELWHRQEAKGINTDDATEAFDPDPYLTKFAASIAEQPLAAVDLSTLPPSGPSRRLKAAQTALRSTLQGIRVHLPFEVMPAWASRAYKRSSALREENLLDVAEELEPLGGNLANAFYALRQEQGEAHWRETLELIRLGLGDDVEDVQTRVGTEGGKIALRIKYRGLTSPVPVFALSDGTLAYLAFVAMYRLRSKHGPSLLAFDEPELHLHPHLLMRVLDFFESMGQKFPVLLATHSDRLLDGLTNPAESVVLCELDEERRTRLRRPDPEALRSWLERYRGIGDLRAQGHDASIWKADEEPR